ncbi:ABC transporter ATP-binding protein [Desulforhopalus sp. 52FAK]
MSQVLLKKVVKQYGDIKVIHDIDLEIQDSEFIVLVGPSGCGKSTTLRMVAGLESISGGEIFIGDKLVNDIPPKLRNIAMVFQDYALYPHMTVFENMAFSLKMKKVPVAERKKSVEKAAEILGITDLLKRKPQALSGGQRQRVAMGRALVRDPEVFLFDEPLSNLDAKLRTQMRMELKKLHMRLKTTTIYVTHDQVEAMTLADRIVIMKDGNIHQVGTPVEVYETPSDMFVAGFIGNPSMNMIESTIVKTETGLAAKVGDIDIQLNEKNSENVVEGQDVILGLRPEAFYLYDETLSFKENSFQGEVVFSEMTGSSSLLDIKAGNLELVAEIEGRKSFKGGEMEKICINNSELHLFDPESEKRIG